MIESNTLGLRVEVVTPGAYSTNVKTDSCITVKFNSELNTDSVINNFMILEDKYNKYIKDSDINIQDYDVVNGGVTYKDKTIFFQPSNQLKERTRYIIYVDKKVSDILNNDMMFNYISYFDTEDYMSPDKPNILKPSNNSIIKSLQEITLSNADSDRYIIEISKQPTFEVISYKDTINGCNFKGNVNLYDGLYYIRAKSINGNYGDTSVFTIKSFTNTAPTKDDIDDDFIYEPYDEKVLEMIKSVPELNAIQVNTKTNLMYMNFNEIIPVEDIDFYESNIYGNYTDEDDQFNTDLQSTSTLHGDVDGSFCVIYDDENEETYVFFIPVSI